MTVKNYASLFFLIAPLHAAMAKVMSSSERSLAIKNELAKGPERAGIAHSAQRRHPIKTEDIEEEEEGEEAPEEEVVEEDGQEDGEAAEQEEKSDDELAIEFNNNSLSIDGGFIVPINVKNYFKTANAILGKMNKQEDKIILYKKLIAKFNAKASSFFDIYIYHLGLLFEEYEKNIKKGNNKNAVIATLKKKADEFILQYAQAYAMLFNYKTGKLNLDQKGFLLGDTKNRVDLILSAKDINDPKLMSGIEDARYNQSLSVEEGAEDLKKSMKGKIAKINPGWVFEPKTGVGFLDIFENLKNAYVKKII